MWACPITYPMTSVTEYKKRSKQTNFPNPLSNFNGLALVFSFDVQHWKEDLMAFILVSSSSEIDVKNLSTIVSFWGSFSINFLRHFKIWIRTKKDLQQRNLTYHFWYSCGLSSYPLRMASHLESSWYVEWKLLSMRQSWDFHSETHFME